MTPGTNCPHCGKHVDADAPLGLCPECLIRSGFATGSAAASSTGGAFVPPTVDELRPLFPHLEILGIIGRGGMGAVYKARQTQLGRTVALKILAPARGADARFAERFRREARALARLGHPSIVTVHDSGEAGGLFYLLMEFVDGPNLRQLQAAHRLTPQEALAIVPPICDALQYAHAQGIVHRDIKPENILVDTQGRVKIADFGIAKMLGADDDARPLTGDNQAIGTPHYMAPEQIEKPETVDRRADIYSLGVVFYEMLTGELPIGRFDPPSRRVSVDVRLDEVVLRALEKQPERRYQQAGAMKTDVETIVSTPAAGRAGGTRAFAGASLLEWQTILFIFASVAALAAMVLFAQKGRDIPAFLQAVAALGFGLMAFHGRHHVRVRTDQGRRTLATIGMTICVIGLPIGIAMNKPIVWGLALAGIFIGGLKLGLFGNRTPAADARPGAPGTPRKRGRWLWPLLGLLLVLTVAAGLLSVVAFPVLSERALPRFLAPMFGGGETHFTHPGMDVRYRLFLVDAPVADRLVPSTTRERGDVADTGGGTEWMRVKPPPNAATSTAEVSAAVLGELLRTGNSGGEAPVLLAQSRRVTMWPRLADSQSFARATPHDITVSMGGFVGADPRFDPKRLRCEYAVTLLGRDTSFSGGIQYEGAAPAPGNARVFLMPVRIGGAPKCLVIAFEVPPQITDAQTRTEETTQTDQVVVEDLALMMIAAMRDADDDALARLASDDATPGYRAGLPHFAAEIRERFRQMTGGALLALAPTETLVDRTGAAVKCTGPDSLHGAYLVLFFTRTADGWRNTGLRNSPPSTPLAEHLAARSAKPPAP